MTILKEQSQLLRMGVEKRKKERDYAEFTVFKFGLVFRRRKKDMES